MHDIDSMSISQKADFSEELIGIHIKTSDVGDKKFRILPVFKMNPTTLRKKLDLFVNTDVIVDDEIYNEFELDTRPIYISEDTADKRPFIYWGAIAPFDGANRKVRLINLIAKPQNGCKAVTKDGNDNNLKMSNIDILPSTPDHPLAKLPKDHHVQRPLPITNDKDPKPFLPPLDIKEDRTIEQLIEDGEIVTSADAARDKTFRWFGVTKSGKDKWRAKSKDVNLGTFAEPLDAARAYNDYVINNSLPYPVNNIPGFLKNKFVDVHHEFKLADVETYKLAEMIVLRTKPGTTDG